MPRTASPSNAEPDRRRALAGAARSALTSWGGALALTGVALSLVGLWPIGLALVGAGVAKTARDAVHDYRKQRASSMVKPGPVPGQEAARGNFAEKVRPAAATAPGLHYQTVLDRHAQNIPKVQGPQPTAGSTALTGASP